MFVHFATKPDRVWHIAPYRGSRLFKFAKQKRFFSTVRKQCLDSLKMRASHGKNMCRPIDQRRSKRLTAQIADVDPCFCADFDRIKTWRLAAHRVHTGRNNFDVLSVPKHTAKKPFRNRTAADITCTDKEDAFHSSESASERIPNLESNRSKSISLNRGEPCNLQGKMRSQSSQRLQIPKRNLRNHPFFEMMDEKIRVSSRASAAR